MPAGCRASGPAVPLSPSQTAAGGLSATSGSGYPEGMPAGNVDKQLPDLYAQALAARQQSLLLSSQLQESQRRAMENWQLIQAAWERAQEILTLREAIGPAQDRLRRSAYARMQAKLAGLPVIEQAKGILMAQCGWSGDEAFAVLRQVSQRENIKVRDLASGIVANVASLALAQRQVSQTPPTQHKRHRASA